MTVNQASYNRSPGPYINNLLAQPACGECPLVYDAKVLPDGACPARLVFVGDEPSATDVAEGRSFVGQAGQLLWHLAKEAGIDRSEIYTTNAILCRSRKVKLSNGAVIPLPVVKTMAAKACRIRLLTELLIVDPAVIVPLGNLALWAVTDIPDARVHAFRGSRIDVDIQTLMNKIQQGLANQYNSKRKEV